MLSAFIILVPLLAGLLTLMTDRKLSLIFGFFSGGITLMMGFAAYFLYCRPQLGVDLTVNVGWIDSLGARFALGLEPGDSLSLLMVMLTLFIVPVLLINLINKDTGRNHLFVGLTLLAQAGLLGVFMTKDALLFYIFWEVALIPVYFLSSLFGGARRIQVTFKFFVYTFTGSLLMLLGILMIYREAPLRSFSWDSFVSIGRSMPEYMQARIFWLMMIAFAIKMPLFPFHTWQPEAYEQSATPVTILLSALMVKMGLFAVVRWLLPVLPLGCGHWMNLIIGLSVISVLYASAMALVQTNIKRLLAYSSMAHVGLMHAAIFSHQLTGMQGAAIQMFNHGIIIAGMWVMADILENRLGTQDIREMGGIAKVAPWFTMMLVIVSLANIALPLTNGFVGEFMMFNGLFKTQSAFHTVFTIIGGAGVIFSAVYTLRMIELVSFGVTGARVLKFGDLRLNEWLALGLIAAVILGLGFYPKYLMDLIYVSPGLK